MNNEPKPKLALALLVVVLVPCLSATTPGGLRIEGVVTSSSGKPLDDVEVTVWRDGRADSVKTDSSGHYEIDLAAGSPVNSIQYSRSEFEPASIEEQLSGKGQQIINKVMFSQGGAGKLSTYEQASVLQAYETIAFETIHASQESHDKAIGIAKSAQRELSQFVSPLWKQNAEQSVLIKAAAVTRIMEIAVRSAPKGAAVEAGGGRVMIFYAEDAQKDRADRIEGALKENKFEIQSNGHPDNMTNFPRLIEVRYFVDQDKGRAEAAKDVIAKALPRSAIRAVKAKMTGQLEAGLIEVWLPRGT